MSTATTPPTTAAPSPLAVPGPVARVPFLDELDPLTAVPTSESSTAVRIRPASRPGRSGGEPESQGNAGQSHGGEG
jgi:hypothetical protein